MGCLHDYIGQCNLSLRERLTIHRQQFRNPFAGKIPLSLTNVLKTNHQHFSSSPFISAQTTPPNSPEYTKNTCLSVDIGPSWIHYKTYKAYTKWRPLLKSDSSPPATINYSPYTKNTFWLQKWLIKLYQKLHPIFYIILQHRPPAWSNAKPIGNESSAFSNATSLTKDSYPPTHAAYFHQWKISHKWTINFKTIFLNLKIKLNNF